MGKVFVLNPNGGGDRRVDLSFITATSDKILTGYIGCDTDGNQVEGTMIDNGTVSASLNAGESYTIPAGYHNGSGEIMANSLTSQTSATAVAKNILSGKTAWVDGVKITGSMISRGSVVSSLNAGESYTIQSGYHTGYGEIIANSLESQTPGDATENDIIQGKITWINGKKVIGSLSNGITIISETLNIKELSTTKYIGNHRIIIMTLYSSSINNSSGAAFAESMMSSSIPIKYYITNDDTLDDVEYTTRLKVGLSDNIASIKLNSPIPNNAWLDEDDLKITMYCDAVYEKIHNFA